MTLNISEILLPFLLLLLICVFDYILIDLILNHLLADNIAKVEVTRKERTQIVKMIF